MNLRTGFSAALLLSGFCGSCLSTAPPLDIRYFSLPLPVVVAKGLPGARGEHWLRLRELSAAEHLGDRLIWSRGGTELFFADDRRWVESPAVYLERAIQQHLFGGLGLVPSEASGAARLDLRLLTFEEQIEPSHRAKISFAFELFTPDDACIYRGLQTAEEVVPSEKAEDFVLALGRALDQACAAAAQEVANQLSRFQE